MNVQTVPPPVPVGSYEEILSALWALYRALGPEMDGKPEVEQAYLALVHALGTMKS